MVEAARRKMDTYPRRRSGGSRLCRRIRVSLLHTITPPSAKDLTSNVMDLYVVLLTAHFHRDGEALQQFVATHADNMNAYDALFRPNDHHLEQRWFLVLRGDHR